MNERELFAAILQKPTAEERAAYLDEVCGEDAALRERLVTLLAQQSNLGSFMEHPPAEGALEEISGAMTAHLGSSTRENLAAGSDRIPLSFLQPPERDGSLGRLGQYEIDEVVGHGGMGIVLKAHDTKLNRIVAVKVLAPQLAANATARKRFLREAQAAAAVSHDHVVTIHAVEEGELPYLVMEFVDGQSLQQKIDRQGVLELKEILRIARQIAAGLAAAHEQGLIHRDVKPSNILLQNGVERVQITDFGLARAADDADITRTGEVTGTPQYMSPEQAQGDPVDTRTDLFSLGSVLYAMCTGRSPFRAETTMASLKRVCEEIPRPIHEINPDIPDWLVTIVDRLMAKDPGERFQSADEVGQILSSHLAHVQHSSTVMPPQPVALAKQPSGKSRLRWPLAAATLLLLVLGIFSLTEATGVTKVVRSVIKVWTPRGTLIVEVDDPSLSITVDRDGKQLTVSDGTHHIFTLRPGEHQIHVSKDGKPVKTELVTITRGGRRVVKISLDRSNDLTKPVKVDGQSQVDSNAFALLGGKDGERKFNTLSEAVLNSQAGDTIEIRGNGPFVTDPIQISHALTMRAEKNSRPVIQLSSEGYLASKTLLSTEAPLVLEGLTLQRLPDTDSQPEMKKWGFLVETTRGIAFYASNCRFLNVLGSCLKVHNLNANTQSAPSVVAIRNCEFLTPPWPGETCNWLSSAHGRLIFDNCVHSSHIDILARPVGAKSLRVELRRNTTIDTGIILNLDELSDDLDPQHLGPAIQVDSVDNIFVGHALLVIRQAELTKVLQSEDADALLPRLLDWSEQQNVHPSKEDLHHRMPDNPDMLRWINPGWKHLQLTRGQDLDNWNELWELSGTGSMQAKVHFAGGDLIAKALSDPAQITAEDFRLRLDSPGHGKSSNGKDLGADIDLVGPGDAYQRWIKTPDYQQWLQETRRLMQNPRGEVNDR